MHRKNQNGGDTETQETVRISEQIRKTSDFKAHTSLQNPDNVNELLSHWSYIQVKSTETRTPYSNKEMSFNKNEDVNEKSTTQMSRFQRNRPVGYVKRFEKQSLHTQFFTITISLLTMTAAWSL